MNRLKTHVNKGDIVHVITGNHRGAEGKVLHVQRAKNRVIIEGVHMIKKHMRKSQDHPNGRIAEREGTIHISNVRRIEASDKKKESAKAASKAK